MSRMCPRKASPEQRLPTASPACGCHGTSLTGVGGRRRNESQSTKYSQRLEMMWAAPLEGWGIRIQYVIWSYQLPSFILDIGGLISLESRCLTYLPGWFQRLNCISLSGGGEESI